MGVQRVQPTHEAAAFLLQPQQVFRNRVVAKPR